MNIKADDPERARLNERGWQIVDPHRVARTPRRYRRYMAGASAEFTAIKGVDVAWRTGWLSDRAAAFLAFGPAGHYRRHRGGKIPARRERILVLSEGLMRRKAQSEISAADWARLSKQARELRGGSLRFRKKSSEYSGSMRDCDSADDSPAGAQPGRLRYEKRPSFWRCKTICGCYSFSRYG